MDKVNLFNFTSSKTALPFSACITMYRWSGQTDRSAAYGYQSDIFERRNY